MGFWGDKEPRHDDFPIYVGDLPSNQSYSKMFSELAVLK